MIKGKKYSNLTHLLIQHFFNDNLQNVTSLWIWWLVHLVGDWLQVACFVKSILSWRAKRRNFYCVRFCQQCASTESVLVSSCGVWLSLHDLLWSEALSCPVLGPVTITWDRKNAIRDMPCFKLSLPYSLWECCVMFTLIRDIDIRPNHLSLAIIFLIP